MAQGKKENRPGGSRERQDAAATKRKKKTEGGYLKKKNIEEELEQKANLGEELQCFSFRFFTLCPPTALPRHLHSESLLLAQSNVY